MRPARFVDIVWDESAEPCIPAIISMNALHRVALVFIVVAHPSAARLCFCDSTGEHLWRLPYDMEGVTARPAKQTR